MLTYIGGAGAFSTATLVGGLITGTTWLSTFNEKRAARFMMCSGVVQRIAARLPASDSGGAKFCTG